MIVIIVMIVMIIEYDYRIGPGNGKRSLVLTNTHTTQGPNTPPNNTQKKTKQKKEQRKEKKINKNKIIIIERESIYIFYTLYIF